MPPVSYDQLPPMERYLSWPQVRPMAGNIGRTTAWRLVRSGEFPPPIKISPNRVAWRESDILAWQASCGAKMEAAA